MWDFLFVVNRDHSSKLHIFLENRVFAYALQETDEQTDRRTASSRKPPEFASGA